VTEFDYPEPVSELLTLGDIWGQREWPDYLALGLSSEHVPDLIRMAQDEELHQAGMDSAEVWAPIHAWRALAKLQAEAAVEPLTELFARIDAYDDDWVGEDLPAAFGVFGPVAIPALQAYLADPSHGLWARVAAARSLAEIGQRYPEARSECIAPLAAQLAHFAEQDRGLNAILVDFLIDLRAVEAAPIIEQAYAADRVDLMVLGDWEDAQVYLGLLDERMTPAPDYPAIEMPELLGLRRTLNRSAQRSEEPKPLAKRKLGRNDPCWCGSGKKYKYCHLRKDQEKK
jgi:hypothetical protein